MAHTEGVIAIVALFALSGVVGAGRQEHAVTPVAKVVELLEKLEAQIAEEGKNEAAQYDKYACFCKEQADGKLYAIETSTEKANKLDAKVSELAGEISGLNTQISDLSTKISQLGWDISNATDTRAAERTAYLADAKNLSDAIDAMDRAIATLEASKSALGGKAETEALAQVAAIVGQARQRGAAASSAQSLRALLRAGQPGAAYEYTYHSNDIIALIKKLRMDFAGYKNDLDQSEFNINSLFEKKRLGLQNEKSFAEKDKSEKEQLAAAKEVAKHATEVERDDEIAAKDADKNFLKQVELDCEAKAELWDQRSKNRAAELTALAEALAALKTGVEPNWGANRKLVDLQAAGGRTARSKHVRVGRTLSFLELKGSRQKGHHAAAASAATAKALQLLEAAAGRLGSPLLSTAALKVRVAEDHFVKVRTLIKDLMARLKMDAMSEATTKSYCDANMKTQIETRDSAKQSLETIETQISETEATKAQLLSEIAALSRENAKNAKALNEATQLRSQEKALNTKTESEAVAGRAAVEQAISILRAFYDAQGSFLQKSGYVPYVPANSDRAGKTIEDLRPEIFDAEYKGKEKESKGVIGLLEVILSDFDRTDTTVKAEEFKGQADFEKFEGDTNHLIDLNSNSIAAKKVAVAQAEDELVTLKDSNMDAESTLSFAAKELEELKKMCVEGEETYEERVAKREKEIEALKEAMQILDSWQS